MAVVAPSSANWKACLQLKLLRAGQKTRLVPLKRYGPLSVQRAFYPEQDTCHVYLLHPPGGVVGGDSLDLQVDLESAANALLTTPGATKFYKSGGFTALIDQQFNVQQNAALEYLPQENIYFPGALVNARTTLQVEPDSHAIVWEKHCFGRPVNHEFFATGQVITEFKVYRQGKLLLLEKQRIDANEIQRSSGLRNYPVIGTLFVYSDFISDELMSTLRGLQFTDGVSGITKPIENVLVIRVMAMSTACLNDYFIQMLVLIRPVVLQKNICRPRIWAT